MGFETPNKRRCTTYLAKRKSPSTLWQMPTGASQDQLSAGSNALPNCPIRWGLFMPGTRLGPAKQEAPAMSGALTDRGFHQRETGMDQGTTPEVNIIGLLGKKKKPLPKLLGS